MKNLQVVNELTEDWVITLHSEMIGEDEYIHMDISGPFKFRVKNTTIFYESIPDGQGGTIAEYSLHVHIRTGLGGNAYGWINVSLGKDYVYRQGNEEDEFLGYVHTKSSTEGQVRIKGTLSLPDKED